MTSFKNNTKARLKFPRYFLTTDEGSVVVSRDEIIAIAKTKFYFRKMALEMIELTSASSFRMMEESERRNLYDLINKNMIRV